MVRIWHAAGADPAGTSEPKPTLRGLVQHLGSGTSTPFRSGEELVRSLMSRVAQPPQGVPGGLRGRDRSP